MTIPEAHIIAGVKALIEPARTLEDIPEWRMTTYRATVQRILAAVAADIWREGHDHGVDYAGDGWNSDTHDPEIDNPYRIENA